MKRKNIAILLGSALLLAVSSLFLFGAQKSIAEQTNFPVAKDTTTSVSLFAVGDIMLDRSVLQKIKVHKDFNWPFLLMGHEFQKYDIRLANLEGPITTFPSVAQKSRFTFTFSPSVVDPLKRFTILSSANNHTDNFGNKGLAQTRNYLKTAGILNFGDPKNRTGLNTVTTTVHGIRFAFVGFEQLANEGLDRVLLDIKTVRSQVDEIIVMPHWGTEYQTDRPNKQQQKDAYKLIDAGADLIIGAHPHVVQPIEQYKGKLIFYSLGNFIFDQYFSVPTMQGLGLAITFKKEDNTITQDIVLKPIVITRESQAVLASEKQKAEMLRTISLHSLVSSQMKKQIQDGHIFLSP